MERGMKLDKDLENFVQEIRTRKDENDKVIAWIAAANTVGNTVIIRHFIILSRKRNHPLYCKAEERVI